MFDRTYLYLNLYLVTYVCTYSIHPGSYKDPFNHVYVSRLINSVSAGWVWSGFGALCVMSRCLLSYLQKMSCIALRVDMELRSDTWNL